MISERSFYYQENRFYRFIIHKRKIRSVREITLISFDRILIKVPDKKINFATRSIFYNECKEHKFNKFCVFEGILLKSDGTPKKVNFITFYNYLFVKPLFKKPFVKTNIEKIFSKYSITREHKLTSKEYPHTKALVLPSIDSDSLNEIFVVPREAKIKVEPIENFEFNPFKKEVIDIGDFLDEFYKNLSEQTREALSQERE